MGEYHDEPFPNDDAWTRSDDERQPTRADLLWRLLERVDMHRSDLKRLDGSLKNTRATLKALLDEVTADDELRGEAGI
jgi:hypothetical protein